MRKEFVAYLVGMLSGAAILILFLHIDDFRTLALVTAAGLLVGFVVYRGEPK